MNVHVRVYSHEEQCPDHWKYIEEYMSHGIQVVVPDDHENPLIYPIHFSCNEKQARKNHGSGFVVKKDKSSLTCVRHRVVSS